MGRKGETAKRRWGDCRCHEVAKQNSPGACRICDGVKGRFHIQSDGGWLDRLLKFRFADQIIKRLALSQFCGHFSWIHFPLTIGSLGFG
jgi:hypothetical protein